MGDEVGTAADRAELDEVDGQLVELLTAKTRGWAEVWRLIDRVERGRLWSASYRSFTQWLEALSRRSHCQVSYLWRVKRAGQAYARFAEREAGRGREVPPAEECGMGDEMIADIDRLNGSNTERTDRFMRAGLSGELTKAEVKRIVAATAGTRASSRRAHGGDVAPGRPTADEVIAALTPDALWPGGAPARRLRGERVPWRVLSEFPVRTGSGGRARRIDALCIGPRPLPEGEAGAVDQYDVVLDMVEVKVSPHDLARDEKHLDYEPFADRCWLAVPDDMTGQALEAAPDGWGVLSWTPGAGLSRARDAAIRLGAMRDVTLATALVKVLPQWEVPRRQP